MIVKRLSYVNRDDCITKSSPLTTIPPSQSGVDTVSPTSFMPSLMLGTRSPAVASPPDDNDATSLLPTGDGTVSSTTDGSGLWPTYPPIRWPTYAPTISPTTSKPTTSQSPTREPQCEGSNPNTCGCASVNQADYRGTINTTVSGKECIRWDKALAGWELVSGDYPDAGLEDNNHCRIPRDDWGSAYCETGNGREVCDVPYCFPSQSSCSSTLNAKTNTTSNDLQAACSLVLCVASSDTNYDLNDYLALSRSDIEPKCGCGFELWDCEFGSKRCESDTDVALMNTKKCCARKMNDLTLTTQAASCDCLIKPGCEDGDSANCYNFAEYCCDENDQQCKCEYKTKACRLALESDIEEVSAMAFEYCGDGIYGGGAQDACCVEDNYNKGLCTCDFWEPLCTDFPNAEVSTICQQTCTNLGPCDIASDTCCNGDHCKCDLFTHAVEKLDYEDTYDYTVTSCAAASNIAPDNEVESQSLQTIYNGTGGEYWHNNTGWTTEQDHCDWFGIKCDEEGYVIEINLPNNNITGNFPANSLSSFYKLQRLVLNNNELHGATAVTNEWGTTDTSIFFNLRDMTHVDLSQNNLSGGVDVLFAPALQYVNFSHNNFTSINSFKKFKQSHETLTVCDASRNFINTSTSDLMKNVPPNIEQFILSNNLIYGPLLTSSLEVLANLRRFDMSMNSLSGELPDFSNSYPNLQVLDLSEQIGEGLVGNIPESLANLPFLSTLILASNQLSGSIPPVLGNMGQLRVLNLSNNKLSQPIPKELGKLGEFVLISYVHFVVQ